MPGPRGQIDPRLAAELRQKQVELAEQVREQPLEQTPRIIAGVDVHLVEDRGVAAAVALNYPGLETVGENLAVVDITFPYIPGFLSFREAPACVEAIAGLGVEPDLVLADGQGRAHPRRFGLACHVGVELGIPTIGVAKSILVGRFGALDDERGNMAELIDRSEVVGTALRTRSGVKPVFVSVGHLITLEESANWVMRTATRFKLPEPSRAAHKLASGAARELRGL